MNRSYYFDYVEEKLRTLAVRIGVMGRLNVLNLNVHAEEFLLFNFSTSCSGWSSQNANAYDQMRRQSTSGTPLNKIVIQVSVDRDETEDRVCVVKGFICLRGYPVQIHTDQDDASGLEN